MNHQQYQPNDDIPFFRPILQYYNALPSITRTWFTLSLITTALHTLEIFDTEQLIFIWDKVVPPKLEIWRILTCFAWAGPGTMVDFSVLLLLCTAAFKMREQSVSSSGVSVLKAVAYSLMSSIVFPSMNANPRA